MDGKSLRSCTLIIILLVRILSLQAIPLIMMKRMRIPIHQRNVNRIKTGIGETDLSCSGEEYRFIHHHNESYGINKAKLRFVFLIGGALSRNDSMNVMRAINGVMVRTG